MILRKLTLHNFGLYRETIEFDLLPKQNTEQLYPLILIGGKNGAGKTTFLEAIRFALYGRRALGLRVSQKEYENYLEDKINHKSPDKSAKVILNFDYSESGKQYHYEVQRNWKLESSKVVEQLEVKKDGEILTSVPKEEWANFLLELIPIGVSQLFFFDGEKIQDIAEDDNNESLAEAIKSLLGIDLVERLKVDLGIYLSRIDSSKKDEGEERFSQLLTSLVETKKTEKNLSVELASLRTTHQSLLKSTEQKQQRFIAEGGDAALSYDQLKLGLQKTNEQLAQARHELVELSNDLLPFLMAPNAIRSFQQALEDSTNTHEQQKANSTIKNAFEAFKNQEFYQTAQWKKEHWADLTNFLSSWGQEQKTIPHPAFQELSDIRSTLNLLNSLESITEPKAKILQGRFIQLTQEKESIEASLIRAKNAKISSLFEDILENERKVGASEQTLAKREDELKQVRWQILTLEREQNNLLELQASATQQNQNCELASKSIKILIEFEKRLLDQKINQLRQFFIEIFNSLLRKKQYIIDIKIDSTSFATTLVSNNGKQITKNLLSAGEKQIYAIAMLWALARTSGRALPMIVDTPLGRLDSEHRENLIKHYFPYASHQVIILSTDTEIHDEYVHLLEDHISHSYHLDYDDLTEQTKVTLGYFESTKSLKGKRFALQQA